MRLLTVALGLLALVWAVDVYATKVHDRVGVGEPPQDLGVFLRAASDVLHGHSPYAFRSDQTYAYPPLVAYLAMPLHPFGVGVAMTISILVSFAAIALALWLLGVRDWRCYCLVPLYPMTRSAVGLGTVGPLLLLGAAAAWRWRDRVVEPALAAGAAVAVKLFLWPLAVWLAVTRRLRAAVASVVLALVFALLPWAAIGFAGLGDYPSLLHKLSDEEAGASYSGYAIGVRLHLPGVVAAAACAVATLVLLAAAARAARDPLRAERERDVAALTVALAAAFVASPIVWIHYFLLLLVPIALTRPRLSPIWVLPFAYWPLGETAWPGADARKLGLALAVAAVVIVTSVRRGAGAAALRPTPSRQESARAVTAPRSL